MSKADLTPEPPNESELIKRLVALEAAVDAIEKRNSRVEGEKAWEQSWCRVSFLVAVTYVITAGVFWAIGAAHPFRNALIPTVGYFLSVQSLPFVKEWWLQRRRRSRL